MTEILIFVNIFIKSVNFYFYDIYNKSKKIRKTNMQINNNTPSYEYLAGGFSANIRGKTEKEQRALLLETIRNILTSNQ